MILFNTSYEAKIVVNTSSLYDEFLFFTASPYIMSTSETYTFEIEVDDAQIIAAPSLWYKDNWEDAKGFIEELMARLGIDEDTAMGLLDESIPLEDLELGIELEDMDEESCNIQRLTARCAKAMGYIGVEVTDEHGTSYMIDATTSVVLNAIK